MDKKINISGVKLEDYQSFRKLDRKSREKYVKEWKEKTGNKTARGWNNSEEYKAYKRSKTERERKLIKVNPDEYFENVDKIKRKERRYPAMYSEESFEQLEGYNAILQIISDLNFTANQAAKRGGKVQREYITLNGETVLGRQGIVRAITEKVREWRKKAAELKKKGETYFMLYFSGEMKAIETRGEFTAYYNIETYEKPIN